MAQHRAEQLLGPLEALGSISSSKTNTQEMYLFMVNSTQSLTRSVFWRTWRLAQGQPIARGQSIWGSPT